MDINTSIKNNIGGVISRYEILRYWPLLILLSIIMSVDISSRFVVTGLDLNVSAWENQDQVKLVPKFFLTKSARSDYEANLDQYLGEVNGSNLKADLDLEGPQPAVLKEGHWSSAVAEFTLLAIYQGSDDFAVFRRVEKISGDVAIIQVRQGGLIDRTLLKEISSVGVVLLKENAELTSLVLFENKGFMKNDLEAGSN